MGVNLALLGLSDLRLDYTDPVVTSTELANVVLTDLIDSSGYSIGSDEGKALQRTLFLGEPTLPEPTVSLKEFISSFLRAVADIFAARGLNNIADQLRGIHNFDRILGEIGARITKFQEDADAQVGAIERFLALMPGMPSATSQTPDISPSHVSESGTGSQVLSSIDSAISGSTIKGQISEIYEDLIIDSLLNFDDAYITNPSGFGDGFSTLEGLQNLIVSRNNDTVPATGTLDRTLYDSVTTIQQKWAGVYSKIMSYSSQWKDYNNIGDFSGIDFSALISGQDFNDWLGSSGDIQGWIDTITDVTSLSSEISTLADEVRAKYNSNLLNDSHLSGFSSSDVSDTDVIGWYFPAPTSTSTDKIISQGKYYYNSSDGKMYKAVKTLTSGDIQTYNSSTSYNPSQYVYYATTNKLYRPLDITTAGTAPTNTSFWREVSFNDTTFWSIDSNSYTQLSALTLATEKMADALASKLTSAYEANFSQGGSYSAGDIVYDGGHYYTLKSGKNITQEGTYDPSVAYSEGEVVTYGGNYYVATTNTTAHPAYSSGDIYGSGDLVSYNDEVWEYVANFSSDYGVVSDATEVVDQTTYNLVPGTSTAESGAIWSDDKISLEGSSTITGSFTLEEGSNGLAFALQNTGTNQIGTGDLGVDGISDAISVKIENSNTASVQNYTTFTPSETTALIFDGSSTFIPVDDDNLDRGSPMTVETWVNVDTDYTNNDYFNMIFSKESQYMAAIAGSGSNPYGDNITEGMLASAHNDATSGNWEWDGDGATGTVPENTWAHVAIVYEGDTVNHYINGNLVFTEDVSARPGPVDSSTSATSGDDSSVFKIGGRGPLETDATAEGLFSSSFQGQMSDFRVWGQARTQSEIQDFKDVRLTGDEVNLLAYFKLDEGTGSTVTNLVDNQSYSISGTVDWLDQLEYSSFDPAVGPGLQFNGTDNYIEIDEDDLDMDYPMTLEAWVLNNNSSSTSGIIADKRNHFGVQTSTDSSGVTYVQSVQNGSYDWVGGPSTITGSEDYGSIAGGETPTSFDFGSGYSAQVSMTGTSNTPMIWDHPDLGHKVWYFEGGESTVSFNRGVSEISFDYTDLEDTNATVQAIGANGEVISTGTLIAGADMETRSFSISAPSGESIRELRITGIATGDGILIDPISISADPTATVETSEDFSTFNGGDIPTSFSFGNGITASLLDFGESSHDIVALTSPAENVWRPQNGNYALDFNYGISELSFDYTDLEIADVTVQALDANGNVISTETMATTGNNATSSFSIAAPAGEQIHQVKFLSSGDAILIHPMTVLADRRSSVKGTEDFSTSDAGATLPFNFGSNGLSAVPSIEGTRSDKYSAIDDTVSPGNKYWSFGNGTGTLTFNRGVSQISFDAVDFESETTVEALDANGVVIASATIPTGGEMSAYPFSISAPDGQRIHSLEITAAVGDGVLVDDISVVEDAIIPVSSGTQDFEGFSAGDSPSSLDFGNGVVADISQTNVSTSQIYHQTDESGAVSSDGGNFWLIVGEETTLNFNQAVLDASFNFSDLESPPFAVEAYNSSGQLIATSSLTEVNPDTTDPFTITAPPGEAISSLKLIPSSSLDGVGFDEIRVTPAQAATALPQGQWQHVAVVWDGTTAKHYIDGEEVFSETFTSGNEGPNSSSSSNLTIGARDLSSAIDDYFDGYIKDFRLWKEARSQSDIDTFKDLQLHGNEENLVGLWSLDEGSGSTVTNAVNGKNSTIQGTVSWNAGSTGSSTTTTLSGTTPSTVAKTTYLNSESAATISLGAISETLSIDIDDGLEHEFAIQIAPGDSSGQIDVTVYLDGEQVLVSENVDASAFSEAYFGFTSASGSGVPAQTQVTLGQDVDVTTPSSQTLSTSLFRPPVAPSDSASTTWSKVTTGSDALGDISEFLEYSGPLSEFWDLSSGLRTEINDLRAKLSSALGYLESSLTNPPGTITDIADTIDGSIASVQSELDLLGTMATSLSNSIDNVSSLSDAETMIGSVLNQLIGPASRIVGALGTSVSDLDTWISQLNAVDSNHPFKSVAIAISDLLSKVKIIYDAYNSGSAPTSTQVSDASNAATGLGTVLSANYEAYLFQWGLIEDSFDSMFSTGEFNPLGAFQATAINALMSFKTNVDYLAGMSSGNGDPLYADIYFSLKNTFENLIGSLGSRRDQSGTKLARLIPVSGTSGINEDTYFDAFRKVLANHSIPNSNAPLTLRYEYALATGDTSEATSLLNQIVNGGSVAGSSSNPGKLYDLKNKFKDLADAIYMPGEDSRSICTTNGNSQTFLNSGSMSAMRSSYLNTRNDIAQLMNEVDTILTRADITDTSSARIVSDSDLATYGTTSRASSISGFDGDNASSVNAANFISEWMDYGVGGSDAKKYHASIAAAATNLMAILSNFEFFFNGNVNEGKGIWGSKSSVSGTPYNFTQFGKIDGRFDEQAYVFNYSNIRSHARSQIGATYDSLATWIMEDLKNMANDGYGDAKSYYQNNVVNKIDNYWVQFNEFHLAVETEARRLVTSAFATTTPMEDIFYSVFEAADLTPNEKRLLSKVLNLLLTLLVAMLSSNQTIRETVQALQRGETTLSQISTSLQISKNLARNMIERAMAMAADMLDRENDSQKNSADFVAADPISTQQFIDMATFFQGNKQMMDAVEEARREKESMEV